MADNFSSINSKTGKPKLLALAGPTGVGKSGLAIDLALKFGGQIVNADSMQVFRRLDIGSAKADKSEQALVPHHLLDLVDPDQEFDVAAYLAIARPVIEDLNNKNIPVLAVGGTGFYLRSLIRGLVNMPGPDKAIREKLKAEAEERGASALHQRLTDIDPQAGAKIHPNDLFRVIRALEIFELTGRPISEFQKQHGLAENPYDLLFIVLTMPRPELKLKLESRTSRMFAMGMVEEVKALLDDGYSPDIKPLRAIGYKQVVALLKGRINRAQAEEAIVKETMRYAKRQMTWFRSQPDVIWHPHDAEVEAATLAQSFWAG